MQRALLSRLGHLRVNKMHSAVEKSAQAHHCAGIIVHKYFMGQMSTMQISDQTMNDAFVQVIQ